MGKREEIVKRPKVTAGVTRRREPLPLVSADERAFWRRAVEIERARLRCAGAHPFNSAHL